MDYYRIFRYLNLETLARVKRTSRELYHAVQRVEEESWNKRYLTYLRGVDNELPTGEYPDFVCKIALERDITNMQRITRPSTSILNMAIEIDEWCVCYMGAYLTRELYDRAMTINPTINWGIPNEIVDNLE